MGTCVNSLSWRGEVIYLELSADQLIVLLDREQSGSISSLGAQENW